MSATFSRRHFIASFALLGTGVVALSACGTTKGGTPSGTQTPDIETPTKPITYTAPTALDAGSQAGLDTVTFKGGTPNIAYLPMGTEFNYHVALFEGLKTVPGAKSFMLSPYSGSDQAAQIGMLQDVTARADVDAIVLISFDEHSLAPLVKRAVEAGKLVLIVNSDIPNYPTPVHGVVGVKQRAANKALAKWAIDSVDGKARKVGVLDGEPSYLATERAGGFEDGIAGSAWKIVSRVNGGWSVDKGNTAAMDLLQAHPDIQVLFAANDYMAEGAALAARSLGRTDLTILGYDGDTAAIESIANNQGVTATTNTSPVEMGRAAGQFVIDLLNAKTEGGYVNGPTEIVTSKNALSILRHPSDLYPAPSKKY